MSKSLENIIWSPLTYKNAAVIAREAGDELLTRLDWLTLRPRTIVDAGCGTGKIGLDLRKRYPHAQVISLDTSFTMLEHIHVNQGGSLVCADAGRLPFADGSVDLIVANLLIPWYANLRQLMQEWRRVLHPEGVVLFTALGPDTMKEWQDVFAAEEMLVSLIDMHDLGDLMMQEKLSDPVLDTYHYTITYQEQALLFHELQATGMLAFIPEIIIHNEKALTEEKTWAVNYEIIFAHAFVPEKADEVMAIDGIARVPLMHLRRKLNKENNIAKK